MRRRVVWVAGCCGPKLSVQWNSFRSAPISGSSTKLAGMVMAPALGGESLSGFVASEAREVMPLAPASEGVILPERERGEFLGHQDPAEVGVTLELDTVHVE